MLHLHQRHPEGCFEGNPLSRCSIGLSPLCVGHPSGYTNTGCSPPPVVRPASTCPSIDRNRFGSDNGDQTHFHTSRLVQHCAESLSLCLSAHHHWLLPGSCFEKYDATLIHSSRPGISAVSFELLLLFRAAPTYNHSISGSLNPAFAVLFNVRSRY